MEELPRVDLVRNGTCSVSLKAENENFLSFSLKRYLVEDLEVIFLYESLTEQTLHKMATYANEKLFDLYYKGKIRFCPRSREWSFV